MVLYKKITFRKMSLNKKKYKKTSDIKHRTRYTIRIMLYITIVVLFTEIILFDQFCKYLLYKLLVIIYLLFHYSKLVIHLTHKSYHTVHTIYSSNYNV